MAFYGGYKTWFLDPVKVAEILRLSEMSTLKLPLRQIEESVGCSKTTVGEFTARCKECDLTNIPIHL